MTVDNFKIIQDIIDLQNKSDDKFYLVQVLIRKGTHLNFNKSSKARAVKHFYITSNIDLEKYKKEIVFLCESTGARAYINLNARSYKNSALKHISLITQAIEQKHESTVHSLYAKAINSTPIIDKKFWLLDFDRKDYASKDDMRLELAKILYTVVPSGAFFESIPSKAGFHIILEPFKKDTFVNECKLNNYSAELKTDSLTNLYIPNYDTLPNFDQISLEFP